MILKISPKREFEYLDYSSNISILRPLIFTREEACPWSYLNLYINYLPISMDPINPFLNETPNYFAQPPYTLIWSLNYNWWSIDLDRDPLKYFFLRVSFHHSFLPNNILHNILVPISKLTMLGSCTLVPSLIIWSLTMSHLMRWNFIILDFPPTIRIFKCITLSQAKREEHKNMGNEGSEYIIRVIFLAILI